MSITKAPRWSQVGRHASRRAAGPLAPTGLIALAMWLLLAACTSRPELILIVSAEAPVERYDLVVMDRASREIVVHLVDEPVTSGDATRDISQAGQRLLIYLELASKGDYLVHLVGRSPAGKQAATKVFRVDGEAHRELKLVLLTDADADGDGFVSAADCERLASPDLDCSLADCNDREASVNLLGEEVCGNGLDEDCDGYDLLCVDADADGVPEHLDCDDQDPDRFPGNLEAPNGCPTPERPEGLAEPRCGDGIDQDCDGQDSDCVVDEDCDGAPQGEDCDDASALIHPGAQERCGNGRDDNCNGQADEGCAQCDLDGDGFQRDDLTGRCPTAGYPPEQPLDCDDTDAGVFPAITLSCQGQEGGTLACAPLGLCDGLDNDCDGEIDEGCPSPDCDYDGDGFMHGGAGCETPLALADCDDADPLSYPGAPDRCGDGRLQDCLADTGCDDDSDGDGYNAAVDCDDSSALIHPGAAERCNGLDDDCDTLVDEGNPDPAGQALGDLYCNDDDDGICGDPSGSGRCICTHALPGSLLDPAGRNACPGENLGASASPRCFFAPQPEIERCDSLDHDCDGQLDAPDGANLLELGEPCGPDAGVCSPGVVVGCDLGRFTDGALNPHYICDASFLGPGDEICNGLDDDCDGLLGAEEEDFDGDGFLPCGPCDASTLGPTLGGCGDCAPLDPLRHPDATELCDDGLDNDCDGLVDCADPGCDGQSCDATGLCVAGSCI